MWRSEAPPTTNPFETEETAAAFMKRTADLERQLMDLSMEKNMVRGAVAALPCPRETEKGEREMRLGGSVF